MHVVNFGHKQLFGVSKFGKNTKIETTNKWEISNPHGPIKLSSQSTAGVKICSTFQQPNLIIMCENAGPKPFAEPKGHVSTFLHPIFFCRAT